MFIFFWARAFAPASEVAELGGDATVARCGAGGAVVVVPAAAGGVVTSAAPICWLAWLTAGLLGFRGVIVRWLFVGGSGRLALGSLLVEVVCDELPQLFDSRIGDVA